MWREQVNKHTMNKFISNKMIEYILKQGISHASNNRQTHRQDNAGLAQRRLGEEVAHDQGDGRHGNHEAPKLRHYPLTRIGNQFKMAHFGLLDRHGPLFSMTISTVKLSQFWPCPDYTTVDSSLTACILSTDSHTLFALSRACLYDLKFSQWHKRSYSVIRS